MKTWSLVLLTLGVPLILSAQPTIQPKGILNALGYQNQLAPDTVFVIFGTGLGPTAIQTATAPYPSTLAGTSVTFVPQPGGAAFTAKMVYSVGTQIAGVLPSSATPGTYAVSVTYNGQSSPPETVTVVPRSLGIATSNSGGTGAAQATIGNVAGGISLARMTGGSISFGGYNWTLTPAHPGDEIVLWGTGGGADSANDTGGSSGDQTAAGNFTVSVAGTTVTPLYSGTSSGYPGLWQVNFIVPANAAADCFAPITVTGGGVQSNSVTIAIAATGQTSCSTIISPSTLSKLDSGTGTITMAGLILGENDISGSATYVVGGVINQYSVGEFLIPYNGPRIDKCTILHEVYPAGTKEPSAPDAQLDAGSMAFTGPGVSLAVPKVQGLLYNATLSSLAAGGSYTLTASGGPQVAPFSIPTNFLNSFTVTNLSSLAVVNRAQPLTVNWTGSGFDTVEIQVNTTTETSTTVNTLVLNCAVPASLGTYTVPTAALAYLTPGSAQLQVTADINNGADISAESSTNPNNTIKLVNGNLVDFGGWGPYIDHFITATVQ
jgi:uncharacterized protein (TIGR03437 family)